MLSQLSYAPSHHLPRRRVVLYTTRSRLSTPECDFFSFFSVLGHALRCARQLSHITAALPWRKTQCAQPKVQLRSADSGDLCRHRLGTPAVSRPPAASRPRTLRHWQSTAPAIIAYSNPAIHTASAAKPPVRTCRRHTTNDVPALSPAPNAAGKYRSRQVGRVFMRLTRLYAPAALMSIDVSAASESRWFCCLGRQNCHIRTCRQSRHTGAILALST